MTTDVSYRVAYGCMLCVYRCAVRTIQEAELSGVLADVTWPILTASWQTDDALQSAVSVWFVWISSAVVVQFSPSCVLFGLLQAGGPCAFPALLVAVVYIVTSMFRLHHCVVVPLWWVFSVGSSLNSIQSCCKTCSTWLSRDSCFVWNTTLRRRFYSWFSFVYLDAISFNYGFLLFLLCHDLCVSEFNSFLSCLINVYVRFIMYILLFTSWFLF